MSRLIFLLPCHGHTPPFFFFLFVCCDTRSRIVHQLCAGEQIPVIFRKKNNNCLLLFLDTYCFNARFFSLHRVPLHPQLLVLSSFCYYMSPSEVLFFRYRSGARFCIYMATALHLVYSATHIATVSHFRKSLTFYLSASYIRSSTCCSLFFFVSAQSCLFSIIALQTFLRAYE